MRYLLPALVFSVLVLLFFIALEDAERPTAKTEVVLSEAPPLEVVALLPEGEAPALTALPEKPVLLSFFASWCVPCLAEHPLLQQLAGRDDLMLYGIGWSDKPADLQAWLQKHGNPFAYLALDASGRTGIAYGITGVPESFLLDRTHRRILYHQRGPLTAEVIKREILPLLEQR